MNREELMKEYEGLSQEELQKAFEELMAYKQSPKIWEDAKIEGQELIAKTNQRIHTLRNILAFRRKESLKNELDEMMKEYAEEDETVEKEAQMS